MAKGIRSIKRGIAVLLSACMIFGMTPIQAGAEEAGTTVSGNETQIQQSANENETDEVQAGAEGNVSNGSDFITWTPIADCMGNNITQYSGTFDGNNKTVSGLYFNGNSTRIGLFGSSESDGNIKNVGVVDSYFKGNDFVGGVCGCSIAPISNCYNIGTVTATTSQTQKMKMAAKLPHNSQAVKLRISCHRAAQSEKVITL